MHNFQLFVDTCGEYEIFLDFLLRVLGHVVRKLCNTGNVPNIAMQRADQLFVFKGYAASGNLYQIIADLTADF